MNKHLKPKTFEIALKECRVYILKLANNLNYKSSILDKDDLISCGMYGLYQCWLKFEDNETTKFSTFAYFRIKGAMIDEIRKHQIHKRNMMDKIKKLENNEEVKNKNEVIHLSTFRNVSSNEHQIKDSKLKTPISKLLSEEKSSKINMALNYLDSPEKKVLNFRYKEELKLKEVGKVLNLSEARVHQIQKSAILKLKDFLDEDLVA